eukprot:2881511-Rhodomonas_salina.1
MELTARSATMPDALRIRLLRFVSASLAYQTAVERVEMCCQHHAHSRLRAITLSGSGSVCMSCQNL